MKLVSKVSSLDGKSQYKNKLTSLLTEFNLKQMWKSPNGTVRPLSLLSTSRDPLTMRGVTNLSYLLPNRAHLTQCIWMSICV